MSGSIPLNEERTVALEILVWFSDLHIFEKNIAEIFMSQLADESRIKRVSNEMDHIDFPFVPVQGVGCYDSVGLYW